MRLSSKNVRLIFHREVRDQLRDRRTLFMIAVLPILLYPLLGALAIQMLLLTGEQPKSVVIVGAKNLPEDPSLLDGNIVSRDWFYVKTAADGLNIITEETVAGALDSASGVDPALMRAQLKAGRSLEANINQQQELIEARTLAEDLPDAERTAERTAELERIDMKLSTLRQEASRVLAEHDINVLLYVPDGFGEAVAEAIESGGQVEYPRILPVVNRADEVSSIAYARLKEALQRYETNIRRQIQESIGLPESAEKPVFADEVELAEQEDIAANVWSRMFPSILIIMAITGAFYPAIDLAAGEKERGTMETLLICPASRGEIVVGKFLTVFCFSFLTAILNLISMAGSAVYIASMGTPQVAGAFGDTALPGLASLIWIPVLLVPVCALFSALSLSLATFAKSSKEGQYYLTPLLMVVMGLTIFTLIPGMKLTPIYSIFPVVGPGLLLRSLLVSPSDPEALVYAVPVLLSSVGYSLIAIVWAIDQFNREDVLFRESDRFDLKLWVKHLLRDTEPLPSASEAVVCFALMLFIQLAGMKFAQSALATIDPAQVGTRTLQLTLVQQIVVIACPAVFMALLLTSSPLRTLKLQLPSKKMFLLGALLPFALHPLAVRLLDSLAWAFPELPPSIQQTLEALGSSEVSPWLAFATFAIAPAICEELAFRGFILSGLQRNRQMWTAVLISSFAFGLFHMIPQQVFNASLLGIVLGLLAVKSGSLLPGIIFHLVNNGLALMQVRYGEAIVDADPTNFFVKLENGAMLYRWPVLLVCLIAAVLLLRALLRSESPEHSAHEPTTLPAGEPALT